ncbi:hypothetical protein DFH27DRAFT_567187 [Peziza echinospora]|nr:hypothetical protein DFH27DRAFT_567187 [Peziza echinospora]
MAVPLAAAVSTPPALRKSLHHLADLWPIDALRPHLSLPNLIRQKADAAGTAAVSKALHDELVAGLALVEGRVSALYPISPRLLHPTTMAEYYTNLARELEVAPKRGWLDGMLASWKGYIRAK